MIARGLACLVASLALSGCAAKGADCGSQSPLALYKSVADADATVAADQVADQAETSLSVESLTCRSGQQDRYAAYTLARMYEKGYRVEEDLDAAARLYAIAASDQPAVTQVYSPPVGKESYGTIITVPTGARGNALPEAKAALNRLTADAAGSLEPQTR